MSNKNLMVETLVERTKQALDLDYVLNFEELSSEEKLGYLRGVQDTLRLIQHFGDE